MSAKKAILISTLILIASICATAGAKTEDRSPISILKSQIPDNDTDQVRTSVGELYFINKSEKRSMVTSSGTGCVCDVMFLTDTTGSMGGYINGIQTAFSGILEAIDVCLPSTDIMYCVADYKDYTDGGNYQTYGVNLIQPFTSNTNLVQAAINLLSAVGGADGPESQLKSMVNIASNWLTPAGDLGFNGRANAQKILIWAGDWPGHISGDEPGSSGSPPAGYYPTLDVAIDALTAQGIIVFALNTSNCNAGLDVPYGGLYGQTPQHQQADEITSATDGILFCNVGSGGPSVEDAIVEAITTGVSRLTLTKVDDVNECVGPGREINYTIYYGVPGDTNCWPDDINDVNIIDYLPNEVDFNSASNDGSYDSDSHTVTWNLGTLSPGSAGSVTLKVKVKCPQPGSTITNCCKIRSGGQILGTAYEYTPVCCPTLTKVDNITGCVSPGDDVNYSICYAANGYGDTNVIITDSLPSEVEFDSATGNYNRDANTITWYIGTLEPNESGCVTLTVGVKCPQPGGTITNCCGMTGDCMTTPVTVCEDTNVCGPPTLTKVDDVDGCVSPGENITYSICYAANGYGDTDVVITDDLPNEVDFNSATGNYIHDANTVTWYIGTLEPNESGYVTLTVRVKYPQPGSTITNHCEMRGDCISPISADENTPVCCCPTLTKVDDVDGCIGPGENITYRVYYASNGYGDTNVAITDDLPNEVDYNSSLPPGDYNEVSRRVTWNIALPPDAWGCIKLVVEVKDNVTPGCTITNYCKMKGNCIDINSTENTSVCHCSIYVDADANGVNNGYSWKDAFNYLQDALDAARSYGCDRVLVAQGIYWPDINSAQPYGTGDREATFGLINGVAIYGGFPVGGGTWEQRNPDAYQTILSGDLRGNDNEVFNPECMMNDPSRGDNSFHVVTGSGTSATAIIDGFTITGGNANGPPNLYVPYYCSGGGIYNDGNSTITNCKFIGNSARYGGGMSSFTGNPNIRNCVFLANGAGSGGGICALPTYPLPSGIITVTNCTFVGNKAGSGGGMYRYAVYSSILNVTNSILWGNGAGQISGGAEVNYSDIEGGWTGSDNINKFPMFEPDGYHLTVCSPCIEAGTNTPQGGLPATDIDGQERIRTNCCAGEPIVDMGADEYYPTECNDLRAAHCPRPGTGAEIGLYIWGTSKNLMWQPGIFAADVDGHDVYFGTDRYNLQYIGTVSEPCIIVNDLNLGTQYYWRVDEVNDPNIWPGKVWSFRVGNYFVVDDFERYNSSEDMNNCWKTGYTNNFEKFTGKGSKCTNYTTKSHSGLGWEEILREGLSTGVMIFNYDNKTVENSAFSEARLECNSLPAGGKDWTGGGALPDSNASISVSYYVGAPENAANPTYDVMYMALEANDGNFGMVLNPDTEAQRSSVCKHWEVNFAELKCPSVRDRNNIDYFYLGFGQRCNRGLSATGGTGTVRFDDIRLYSRKPSGLTADYTCDCKVNLLDFGVFAENWLAKQVADLNVTQPHDPCILWYKFNETTGRAIADWSGNGYNGVVDSNRGGLPGSDMNMLPAQTNQLWDTGGHDGGCIDINYLVVTDFNVWINASKAALEYLVINNKNSFTFSVWINGDVYMPEGCPRFISVFQDVNAAAIGENEVLEIECPIQRAGWGSTARFRIGDEEVSSGPTQWSAFAGTWQHYAFVRDGVNNKLRIYHNGVEDVNQQISGPMFGGPIESFRIGGPGVCGWTGKIDDFKIYDYALSDAEAGYIGTGGTGYVPFVNIANLKSSTPEIVDFGDFAIFAQQWMMGPVLWP